MSLLNENFLEFKTAVVEDVQIMLIFSGDWLPQTAVLVLHFLLMET